jgi:exonuclease SbcC
MILLKSIQLKNFLSHPDTRIEFQNTEKLLIDGKSGSGKSSIVDALLWTLYNVGRVQNRSLIKRGKTESQVAVELIDGENTFEIIRKISTKGLHTISVNQNGTPIPVAGTKNIQTYIEKDILKCSYILFINSVCYPQENLESFVKQTPAKRKDLILELVNAEAYETYYEKIRELIITLNEKLSTSEGKKERLKEELTRLSDLANQMSENEIRVNQINEQIKAVNADLEIIRTAETKLLRLRDQINNLNSEFETLDKQCNKLQTEKSTIALKIKSLEDLDERAINAKVERLNAVKAEILTLEGKLKEYQSWKDDYTALLLTEPKSANFDQQIQTIISRITVLRERTVSNEKCPHCEQEHVCGLIQDEINNQIELLEKQLKTLRDEKLAFETNHADFLSKLAIIKSKQPEVNLVRLNELKTELPQLEPYLQQSYKLTTRNELLQQYSDDLNKLTLEINSIIEQIDMKHKVKIELETQLGENNLTVEKLRLTQKLENLNLELFQAIEQLGLSKNAKEQQKIVGEEIDQITVDNKSLTSNLENLSLLKDAFGSNGIKSIVIDYVLPQLELRINQVLQPLSEFRIKLDTQKSSVDGENTIEGLFITVINEQGEEFDFGSYSGGERLKILFSITEGLASLQKIGFRILDEAVIGLDEESGDQFAQAILAFQEKFQQLICISHLRQIKELFDHRINIIKIHGDSQIV